ncbi:MAG: OmpA family protein [Calditrichaeota bacterium]|nr:OmpA family protein [Calditrichota bacterium]
MKILPKNIATIWALCLVFLFFHLHLANAQKRHKINATEPPIDSKLQVAIEKIQAVKKHYLKEVDRYVVEQKWDSAIVFLKRLEELWPEKKEFFAQKREILSRPTRTILITNLGDSINSKYSEYFPVISVDDKSLFFTARDRPGGFGGEDIWSSKKIGGLWSKAVNVGRPLNTSQHEGLVNLSPDSSMAFIYGNYPDSHGNGDIYYAELHNNRWGKAINLGPPVNSPFFESDACLSSDGRTLFFVSDRPGVVGKFKPKAEYRHPFYNSDIFVSFKTDSGWSEPLNLGETINTEACERGPLFHPDGRTLFFCSSGHPGLGDLDLFVAYRIGDGWTEWTKPMNLGKEINTVHKDWGYSIPLSGDKVYFSSVRPEGLGRSDIYVMLLPERLTNPVTIVSGKVTDLVGKPIEKVEISWEDLETFKVLGITHTRANGDYTILLPSGRWYSYTASKDSFIFASRDVDLREKAKSNVEFDLKLPRQNAGDLALSSALLNVFFELNQSTLRPESKSELDRFLRLLQAHPEWTEIEIGGHTCDLGSREYNRKLSSQRAASVVKYLVQHGIQPGRLIAKGYGYDNPLVEGFSDEARKKNRRVEFRVIKLRRNK